jgi:signal recognition particle GTPase
VGYVVTEQAFAILLAAAFTFGCAAIYEMRNYAREVTGILFRVALCLGPFVALVAIAHQEEGGREKAARPIAHQSSP